MLGTNGIPVTNNLVFNTYRSALVITGTNNLVQNNLVSSVYWLGTGQPAPVAAFNFNNDGAIMTRDVNSVRLLVSLDTRCVRLSFVISQDNLVAGVERLAYRVHGETCGGPTVYVPPNITNEYSNNEAHSAMAGVSIWPSDKGFIYDRSKP